MTEKANYECQKCGKKLKFYDFRSGECLKCHTPIKSDTVKELNSKKEIKKTKEQPVFCHKCGKKNLSSDSFCEKCGTKLNKEDITTTESKTGTKLNISENKFDPKKHVKEFKRKCKECGKVWHSLASREKEIEKDVSCNACIQASTACGGNLGAATQSKRNVESQEDLLDKLKRCPNCGSKNYTEEIVIYEKK